MLPLQSGLEHGGSGIVDLSRWEGRQRLRYGLVYDPPKGQVRFATSEDWYMMPNGIFGISMNRRMERLASAGEPLRTPSE